MKVKEKGGRKGGDGGGVGGEKFLALTPATKGN